VTSLSISTNIGPDQLTGRIKKRKDGDLHGKKEKGRKETQEGEKDQETTLIVDCSFVR